MRVPMRTLWPTIQLDIIHAWYWNLHLVTRYYHVRAFSFLKFCLFYCNFIFSYISLWLNPTSYLCIYYNFQFCVFMDSECKNKWISESIICFLCFSWALLFLAFVVVFLFWSAYFVLSYHYIIFCITLIP